LRRFISDPAETARQRLRIQGLDNAIGHFDEVILALSKIPAGVYSI
jgi:hypothetical protein